MWVIQPILQVWVVQATESWCNTITSTLPLLRMKQDITSVCITTFEGGCTNNNCLLDGDQVCDTPPDGTSDYICPANSCSTDMNDTSGFNPFNTDMNDLPNYMDYTSCPLSFTIGQSSRMNASLAQIRTTLLQSNGCGQNPGGSIPVASFTSSNNCNGTTFINTSLNSVGAQWDFDNDGIIDDCGNTITHVFPGVGNYTVTMYAAGFGGTDSITQTIFAQPYPYQNYPLVNGYSGIGASLYTGQLAFCQGSTIVFPGRAWNGFISLVETVILLRI